jgi:hypothetical protein
MSVRSRALAIISIAPPATEKYRSTLCWVPTNGTQFRLWAVFVDRRNRPGATDENRNVIIYSSTLFPRMANVQPVEFRRISGWDLSRVLRRVLAQSTA